MFHHLMYKVTAGVNDVNVDMSGVPDTIFTVRSSNHFMFTEKYQILAAMHLGTSVLRVRTNMPTLNTYGRHQIFPVNRSATPPSPPRLADYRYAPIPLPIWEELALEESGNLGAATEPETTHLWLGTMDWSQRIPRGIYRQMIRATAAITTVANAWSGPVAIVPSDSIAAGWYAVIGAYCFEATTRSFRLAFNRFPSNQPRNYRPGSYSTNALGNIETFGDPLFNQSLGFWGAFHTSDLVQCELYGDAGAAVTADLRLDTVYLGAGDPGQYPQIAI